MYENDRFVLDAYRKYEKGGRSNCRSLPAGTPCLSVKEVPADIDRYDCVFLGFWVDRGTADKDSQDMLKQLTNKHVAIFATLGADPKSEHAAKSLDNGAAFLPESVHVAGTFICQGAVDPKLIEMMYKQFPAGHPHGKSPERDAFMPKQPSIPMLLIWKMPKPLQQMS